ncbi:MAG: [Fe-Fe] hydrogenase large subunit C-terminal domain-containing protein [Sedimentisphaerales bacterium]|nr:[Fe-Fe] hydrogenase large subunit C-terminal domain-containing protein [Sedimentisphaerales bacterium]
MNDTSRYQIIQTVPERCRVCYTCVRECPAKAIRIVDGQARVLHERCIGCGNCVRVCSQNAKVVVDSIPKIKELLAESHPVAAILAPSFPAEFCEYDPNVLAGLIRTLGFRWVNEVAFGADLVAHEYERIMNETTLPTIATSCPAVVLYVEKYYPDMLDALAPVVSPMVATARMLRALHGDDIRIVFIGPCVAKKREGVDDRLYGDIDAVMTFVELRSMISSAELDADRITPEPLDEPYGDLGALFPLCGGMLQAARLREDLLENDIVSANGKHFTEAIKEYASGDMETHLLELLACDGCIMGAGMGTSAPLFRRRASVSNYVKSQMSVRDPNQWKRYMERFKHLDLGRAYTNQDQRLAAPDEDAVALILKRMGKLKPEDELNCGACGYETCREHAVAIHKGLAESEMCLPYTIDRLNATVGELEESHKKLASTQEALMQSERLASMGQLAAGIAHEVNNPLGVVLMYAHLMLDSLEEDCQQKEDARMVVEQADRCKKIVAGLLHFARQNKVLREPTDLTELLEKAVRAVVKPRNITLSVNKDLTNPVVDLDPSQMLQVFTNIISNAYAAMPDGGELKIAVSETDDAVTITISDTGTGIPRDHRNKIFEPFFTTKQIGRGTGLGLAVSYGIVKMHNGQITVDSNDNSDAGPTGTTFMIQLPRKEEV